MSVFKLLLRAFKVEKEGNNCGYKFIPNGSTKIKKLWFTLSQSDNALIEDYLQYHCLDTEISRSSLGLVVVEAGKQWLQLQLKNINCLRRSIYRLDCQDFIGTICAIQNRYHRILNQVRTERLAVIYDISATLFGNMLNPPHRQSSRLGNCGYIMLAMCQLYWNTKGWKHPLYWAQPTDFAKYQGVSLMEIGRQLNINPEENIKSKRKWAIFTINDLCRIIDRIGYDAIVYKAKNPYDLEQMIDLAITRAKMPVFIAFDINDGDQLEFLNGKHAHWGMIFGITYDPLTMEKYYVLAHSYNGYFFYRAKELCASNFQLKTHKNIKLDIAQQIAIMLPHKYFSSMTSAKREEECVLYDMSRPCKMSWKKTSYNLRDLYLKDDVSKWPIPKYSSLSHAKRFFYRTEQNDIKVYKPEEIMKPALKKSFQLGVISRVGFDFIMQQRKNGVREI